MKLHIIIYILAFFVLGSDAYAQSRQTSRSTQGRGAASSDNASAGGSKEEENPCVEPDDKRFCFTLDPMTGIKYDAVPDTSYHGLANAQTMEGRATVIAYTSNLYSPHLVMDYFARKQDHDFLFFNPYHTFRLTQNDIKYFNTRLPYTRVMYGTSGSGLNSNDHFKLEFAGNVNSKVGVGSNLDYVYARGLYTASSTKPLNWNSYVYYDGERYKAFLNYTLGKLANQENQGILSRDFVLRPDNVGGSRNMDDKSFPVVMDKTWNDIDHWNLHLTHQYDLGRYDEVYDPSDSTYTDVFTPVASIFHSLDLLGAKRVFRQDEATVANNGYPLFKENLLNKQATADSTSYFNFSTYAGIRVNEGFSKWSQFALSAFLGYERESYTMIQDTLGRFDIEGKHVSNSVFVGGQLSRHKGKYLKFDATAKVGLSGDKVGDVDINASINGIIPFGKAKKDSLLLSANGYFRNRKAPYLTNHYLGNHLYWDNDFDPEQRFHIDGTLSYPKSGTSLRAGIEHISNYIYFDGTFMSCLDSLKAGSNYGKPMQTGEQIDIFSLSVSQKLAWKALYCNATMLFQTSTQEQILSLPKLSFVLDLGIRFNIAHSLYTNLGCTAYYNTKYYAPNYIPDVQQFGVQNEIECGGYPVFNAYINCSLKKLKFYVMASGLGTESMSNDRFIMPYYPHQPWRLEYGVVFDLQN